MRTFLITSTTTYRVQAKDIIEASSIFIPPILKGTAQNGEGFWEKVEYEPEDVQTKVREVHWDEDPTKPLPF